MKELSTLKSITSIDRRVTNPLISHFTNMLTLKDPNPYFYYISAKHNKEKLNKKTTCQYTLDDELESKTKRTRRILDNYYYNKSPFPLGDIGCMNQTMLLCSKPNVQKGPSDLSLFNYYLTKKNNIYIYSLKVFHHRYNPSCNLVQ